MGICNSTSHKSSNKKLKVIAANKNKNSTTTSKASQSTSFTSTKPTYILPYNLCKHSDIQDEYIILSELGSGVSGTVCEAESISTKAKFAIKRINKSTIKFKDNIIKEAELNRQLNHPNIIKCYDIYEDESTISFVLELGEGGDLFDFIINSPNKSIPLDLAIDLIEQMLETISFLHNNKRIVHRDLKPENFMISINANNTPFIKLIDFGFATNIPEGKNNLLSDWVGTPAYAAPELILHDDYDEKVDMWAIGVIMFNMLTGLEPFQGKTKSDLYEEIRFKKIKFDVIKDEQMRSFISRFLDRNAKTRINAKDALRMIKQIKKEKDNLLTIDYDINNNNNNLSKINKKEFNLLIGNIVESQQVSGINMINVS